jgi:methionine synthase II (cobalamin-independent)
MSGEDMLRTTVVGSWPPPQEFERDLQRYHHGELAPNDAEALLREVAARAIREQRECGLDEYTGGETSADTFILHFPHWFSGLEPLDPEAWDGRGTYRVTGSFSAPQGLGIARAYRREKGIDAAITKVTIPGPSELTMLIEPEAERPALWDTIINLIRQEIYACRDLGARDIQLDLPHIAMGLVDQKWNWTTERAVDVIQRIFDNVNGVRRSVHFCYGDFDTQTWTEHRSFHPLLPTIQALDGIVDRVVLELSLPEQWAERALLAAVPASMEVAAWIVDVKSPSIETVSEIQSKLHSLLEYVSASRLLICPSCGLGRRNTELAIGKVTAMVQAVRAVNAELAARIE